MNIDTRKLDEKMIRERLGELGTVHPEIKRIILFGSLARGTGTRHSDIDLILISETTKPFFERYNNVHKDILDLFSPHIIDFFIYTHDEFKRMIEEGNKFILQVIKEGKVLYER